jgi:hypothetical protein
MEELVSRLVSNVGVSEEQAGKAIEVILNFLKQAGPADKVNELMEKIPGASDLVGTASEGGGGLLGGLGGMGGGMMGAMGAMGELTSAGLGMGEVQGVTKEVVGYAKEHAGSELVDEIVGSIPGISQFV